MTYLNPIEIKIEEYRFLRNLQKHHNKNYIYRFQVDGLLFSSGITNEANVLFITCNCLNSTFEGRVSRKPHKSLGVRKMEIS